jgi:hypothetical protein
MKSLACALALAVAAWPPVRSAASPRCVPTNRFVVLSGGLVRDTLTKLVWQQQVSSTPMTRASAQSYCPSGFRLPTIKELSSLVDLTVTSGAKIDQTAFPGTPGEGFWTSTQYAASPYGNPCLWHVDFNDGGSFYDDSGGFYRVRCVR